jgi:hypothetical protein
MASTLSIQNAINFVTPLLKNQPVLVSNQEPGLTAANMVLATMLAPPMRWRFNRKNVSFAITSAGTDYTQAVAGFGFIETQWLVDGSGVSHAMNGAISLGVEGAVGRPERIAPQYDDNAGNITFRVDKKPSENYTVFLDYQQKPPILTSPASLWAPVPDEFLHIYNYGFLCLMSLLVNDSRFPIYEGYFIARLLGVQDGLTDQERNIFVANWTALAQTLKRSDGAVTAGNASRVR